MSKMNFIGPAQEPFNSFMELARSKMETYCHDWNNPLKPSSFILPPVYSFKNADKSDEDIEKIMMNLEQQKLAGVPQNKLDSIQKAVIFRCSENGEFVVFHALWTLIQDKVAEPFLAIHGLNLDNVRHYFQQIFPHALINIEKEFKAMMREYDMVLIGPKIGLIVIEIKSSHFLSKKDFVENNKHLPRDIIKALEMQLDSFDPKFFQVCYGGEVGQEVPIRKILFTPNLEKSRFETWLSSFDTAARKEVLDKFDGVTHWFREDMINQHEHDQKPPLYSVLQREMDRAGYQIPYDVFEPYGLIISGLSSAVVLQNEATVSTERLSIRSAILRDDAALFAQNPTRQRLDKNDAGVIEVGSSLVLLTPKQQEALNGPNIQLLIGSPGSGKTIILQEKAAQLIKEGKKVLIFAKEPYDRKYQTLFHSHASSSCKIEGHGSEREVIDFFDWNERQVAEFERRMASNENVIRESLSNLSEHIPGILKTLRRQDFADFDAILIDDTFDRYIWKRLWKSRRIYQLILLTVITKSSEFRPNLLWVACDSHIDDYEDETYGQIVNKIIQQEQGDYFKTTILDQVMRSSENVFHATFSPEIVKQLAIKPVAGHKIHGFFNSVVLCNFSLDQALLKIWKHVDGAVKKFKEEGFDFGHIAIIAGGEWYDDNLPVQYIEKKFSENKIRVCSASEHSSKLLTLDNWSNVSSFEWPVVIYIAMFMAHEDPISSAYYRYRACSRATMKLFEIIADTVYLGIKL